MQTRKVNVSKDTQYVVFSWAQLIFRHQKTITHHLDGYLNRLETCSGAWGLDSLLSSSEGWEMTYCPWQPQGSLSSPGTLRKQTATVVTSLPTLAAYGHQIWNTHGQLSALSPKSCRKRQGKSWYLHIFSRAERRLFRRRAKRRTVLLL